MSTKIVKAINITGFGTYPIMGGSPDSGIKTPAIDCSSFEDAYKAKEADPQPELTPFKCKLGVSDASNPRPTCGTSASITIRTYWGGGGYSEKTISGFLSDVQPSNVEVNGDRVAVWECEFTPSGGGTTTTTTTTTV